MWMELFTEDKQEDLNMAISSQNTKLMIGTETYDIKDFPVILGERSALETTTLSDDAQTYIQGIRQQSETFPFLANYDATVYAEINTLTDEQECLPAPFAFSNQELLPHQSGRSRPPDLHPPWEGC